MVDMASLNKRIPDAPDKDKPTPSAASSTTETPVAVAKNPDAGTQQSSPSTDQPAAPTSGGSPQTGTTATTASSTNGPSAPVTPINVNNAQNVNGSAAVSSTSTPLSAPSGTMASSSTTLYPTATAASNSTSQALESSSTSANDRLPNGAVAGVVIAVALGLAFLTFLVTFFTMRRNEGLKKERQIPMHEKPGYMDADRKGPLVAAKSRGGDSLMNSLPQSADDTTIRRSVEATLDQVGLHVENFYQNTPTSRAEIEESELKSFDSSFLPAPLAVMLPQSTKASPILRHTLSNFVTTSISPMGNPAQSLLPAGFVLLPSKTQSSKSSTSEKPEFRPCFSRWRQLTAYLLPNPLEDAAYGDYRNRQIDNMIRGFSRVFGPWENPQYGSDQRSNSLSAILKGASELGILLFSQPSELQFRWPNHGDSVDPNQLALTPTLVKTTDERGARLRVLQTLVEAEYGAF